MRYDVIIIGGGPAGLSAALTLRQRNKTAAVVTGGAENIPLYKSKSIDNYPGLPRVSGRTLLETLEKQAADAGAALLRGRATSVLPMDGAFGVAVGQEFYECGALILCTGVAQGRVFPGEKEFLGRGVSYCVTCDGMLYRGKAVCVAGFTSDTEEEARLLRDMGCRVEVFTGRTDRYAVEGADRVERLVVNGEAHPCEGVFILRPTIGADTLLEGLPMDGPHVRVDRDMAAGLPGVFAAGDCAGRPYQAAKAAGEGNVAALSAARYLENLSAQKGG